MGKQACMHTHKQMCCRIRKTYMAWRRFCLCFLFRGLKRRSVYVWFDWQTSLSTLIEIIVIWSSQTKWNGMRWNDELNVSWVEMLSCREVLWFNCCDGESVHRGGGGNEQERNGCIKMKIKWMALYSNTPACLLLMWHWFVSERVSPDLQTMRCLFYPWEDLQALVDKSERFSNLPRKTR